MLHELLAPRAADVDLLAFQALLQMHSVSLLATPLHVLLNVVVPDGRDDSPEETAVRPPSQVHLVVGHVLDNLWVVAHLVPDVLRSVFRQVVSDPIA